MGLFSKKKGGTFFGNLLASVANKATGGLLGAKRVAALASGNLASINPDAKQTGKMLGDITFAGEQATQDADGTITMKKNLEDVTISAKKVNPDTNIVDGFIAKLGDKLSYLGGRATDQTKVGLDDSTKWLIGGGIAAIAIVMLATKKN